MSTTYNEVMRTLAIRLDKFTKLNTFDRLIESTAIFRYIQDHFDVLFPSSEPEKDLRLVNVIADRVKEFLSYPLVQDDPVLLDECNRLLKLLKQHYPV